MESPTGVVVSTAEDLYNDELTQAEMEGVTDGEEVQGTEAELSLLASHIVKTFETNKEARKRSGIEDEIFDSLRDYNGEYNPDDLSKIASEGGSSIYMNLTATKSRAAMSWIRDILQSANEDAFSLAPTPIPALPEDINQKLEEAFRVQFLTKTEEVQQGMGAAPSPKIAQETLLSLNRDRRDIKDAVLEEINLEAREQMSLMERKVKDDLKEGGWDQALSNFIEDFCIFPNAFMKGPVITKKDRLRWEAGKPIIESAYTFINKRVAPIDIYPSPTATSIQDGCLIEHLRLTAEELAGLKGAIGYNTEAIDKLLEENTNGISWLNTGIEDERAEEERRGNKTYADEGIFHALHFWGPAKASDVEDWGLELDGSDPNKFVEIEAILVGNEVIKCKLNNDPLKRRPYYKASYQNIPGSFWGRSLPSLMRDIQRMCNACARALANNMGLACLTGDTVVYRHEQNGRAYSEIIIKELYDKKDLYNSGLKRTRLRSLDESTGEFYLNKVNGVLYNGHKAVYELKTESGYRVKATEDHRFLKDDGEYDYLMNFLPGDLIAVNGSSNVPTKLCSDCGCPIKPSSQRCKKCHTKNWNEIQRELARDNYWNASHSSSRQRKDVLEARKDYCEICGKVGCKFEVHHKNANPLDNSSENLINLCIACHRTEDAKRRAVGDPYKNRYLTFDKVISIEYVGQEDVYDIQMEAPNHNFVANGFVVHNCGPQIEVYIDRLADAGDIEDIKPLKIWQVTNDPTGASGRAINFFQVPSIANELMGVYDKFEQKADDATGIPRYSYGNEKVGGAAQALADYEKALTPDGPVYINKLVIGDILNNTYGSTSRVTGVFPQGECDIFRVKFSNGEHVDCDMNHRWSVKTHIEREFKTLTTEEILDKGLFRVVEINSKNPKGFRPKWMLPKVDALEFTHKDVKIDPYTMGAILGDGDNRARLTSMDQEVFDNIPYKLGKKDYKDNNKAWSQTILGIREDLRGYIGKSICYNKFIPKDYLWNSVDVRMEVLKGLMDTDGCISKTGDCFYFTVSKQLAEDFKWLVKSLGGSVKSIQIRADKRESRVVGYRIAFNTTFCPVKLKRKAERFNKKDLRHVYITGIEYVGKSNATCITVDSKDSLFTVDNFIPTHNTASGLSMLLESATKSIKDAIRHIDSGLIIPRVEYQFYWNLIKTAIPYTGDVNVIAHGSDTLTLRGAQQAKRQEFLQITANQSDQDLMGPEGRAELIRELAKDLNLRTEVVPSRLELRKKVEEAKAAQAQAVQQGQTKDQSSLMATKLQVEAQQRMHEQTQQVKLKELDLKAQTDQERATLEREKLAVSKETADSRAMIDSQKMNIDSQTKRDIARTGASVSILQSQNKVQNATK